MSVSSNSEDVLVPPASPPAPVVQAKLSKGKPGAKRTHPPTCISRGSDGEVKFRVAPVGRKGGSLVVSLLTQKQALDMGETECPITLEPFNRADVDFLPGARLVPEEKDLVAAKLPCNHVMGAIPLVYHMMTTNIRCPICRSGSGKKISLTCVPKHIRKMLKSRVDSANREERELQETEDSNLVRDMFADIFQQVNTVYLCRLPWYFSCFTGIYLFWQGIFPGSILAVGESYVSEVKLVVYLYTQSSIDEPASDLEGRATARRIYMLDYVMEAIDSISFVVPAVALREIFNHINSLGAVSMRLTAYMRSLDDRPLELSNTTIFHCSNITSPPVYHITSLTGDYTTHTAETTVPAGGGDCFEFSLSSGSTGEYDTLLWKSSQHILQRLISG